MITLKASNGVIFLGAGVVIGYLWAVKSRPCPDGRRAAERPVSDDNATPENVVDFERQSTRKVG